MSLAAPIDAVENAMLRQSLYGGDLATNLLELAVIDEHCLLEQLAITFELEMAPSGPLSQASDQLKIALSAEAAEHSSLLRQIGSQFAIANAPEMARIKDAFRRSGFGTLRASKYRREMRLVRVPAGY